MAGVFVEAVQGCVPSGHPRFQWWQRWSGGRPRLQRRQRCWSGGQPARSCRHGREPCSRAAGQASVAPEQLMPRPQSQVKQAALARGPPSLRTVPLPLPAGADPRALPPSPAPPLLQTGAALRTAVPPPLAGHHLQLSRCPTRLLHGFATVRIHRWGWQWWC